MCKGVKNIKLKIKNIETQKHRNIEKMQNKMQNKIPARYN